MIKKLQNNDAEISRKIQSVFQDSYTVEAQLLNAIDFPPLKRKLESYTNSNNEFFGYLKNEELTGVIEINNSSNYTHIQSLVVSPKFFRQGIGRELMEFTLNSFGTKTLMVETGVNNGPATTLYKKLGFIEVKQWNTGHGIRKIRFEKYIDS